MKPSLKHSAIVVGVAALAIIILLTKRSTPPPKANTLGPSSHPSPAEIGVTSTSRINDLPIEGTPTIGDQEATTGTSKGKRIPWPETGGSIFRGSNYAYRIVVVTNPVVQLIGSEKYELLARNDYRVLAEQPETGMPEIMEIVQNEGAPANRMYTVARLAYELISEDLDTGMVSEVRKQLAATISEIDREYDQSPESRESFKAMAIAEADREISLMAESRTWKMQHLRSQIAQLMGQSNEVMFLKLGSVRPRIFASPLILHKEP